MKKEGILTSGISGASYSPAIKAGKFVFISGQVAVDSDGKIIGKDLREQTRQVFKQIEKLMIEAGGGMTDVVKITTYLTDISQYGIFSKIRGEVFKPPFPASVAVEVSSLLKPEMLIEVDAIGILQE